MTRTADIAATLQGYDPQALRADAVSAFLRQLVEPVTEVQRVPLPAALGRVLAEDVVSPISVPPHDNSAMDGYAFDGAQLRPGQPLRLRCVGTALAGAAWRGALAPGDCVKIMTGAVMPAGLDTVVPQEFIRVEGAQVELPADVARRGDNRRLLGEDLMAGRVALPRGTRLSPAALGLLASLGLGEVAVLRRLRVAYFSTGDEILSLGQAPREGAVYDSNRDLGVVPDRPDALRAAFGQAAARADAVITSGGVSVGEADHTRAMMRQLGDVVFWRIAMRPGRPMAVGRIAAAAVDLQKKSGPGACPESASSSQNNSDSAILFGLPGNPVAVMVTFLAFVRPALLRMMGARPEPPVLLRAQSSQAIAKKPGRTEYQRGIVSTQPDGRLRVCTTGNQGSGVLSSMVQANGLIVLGHAQGDVAVGDEVSVMMFEGVL